MKTNLLNSVKSHLSREEMRVVNGGLRAPNLGPNCGPDAACPLGCSSDKIGGTGRECDSCCNA